MNWTIRAIYENKQIQFELPEDADWAVGSDLNSVVTECDEYEFSDVEAEDEETAKAIVIEQCLIALGKEPDEIVIGSIEEDKRYYMVP